MNTPFDREAIRMAKVALPELHSMIMARTNRQYMPLTHQDAQLEAGRPSFNSKPEYIGYGPGLGQLTFERFRDAVGSWGSSGYYARSDMGPDEKTIYAVIELRQQKLVLFVNLISLETYVGEWQEDDPKLYPRPAGARGTPHILKWFPWPRLQHLAIDRVELATQIDQL